MIGSAAAAVGELKTSFLLEGEDEVDEFVALCFVLELRPHELVRRLVAEGAARCREGDPDLDEAVRTLSRIRRRRRRLRLRISLEGVPA